MRKTDSGSECPSEGSATDKLAICTLGNAEVFLDGHPVHWRADSARTLFFYLLTYPEGKSRTEIIQALWGGEPDALLSNRFRVVVHRARAALGTTGSILEDHNRYRLAPHVLAASDICAFQADLKRAERDPRPEGRLEGLQRLLTLYAGEYLPFETADWALEAQGEHRAAYGRAELALSSLLCDQGQCAASVSTLSSALRSDPFVSENHHQRLMTCLSVVDSKYAAIEHYRRFIAFLRVELDDGPMPETLELADRVKNGEHICRRKTQVPETTGGYDCPFSPGHQCGGLLHQARPVIAELN